MIRKIVFSLLVAIPFAFTTADAKDDYEALVDEILEVTGALEIGAQMSQFVVAQMTQALKTGGADLPDEAYVALEDEVNKTIDRAIASGSFGELMYPIYRKHLGESDLKAMIDFYRTPSGKKIAAAIPLMAQEGMMAGQIWGQSLGPSIAERVEQRLKDEGFEL